MAFNVESYKTIGTCGVYCVNSGVNIYICSGGANITSASWLCFGERRFVGKREFVEEKRD
jgi:hypothetical protein